MRRPVVAAVRLVTNHGGLGIRRQVAVDHRARRGPERSAHDRTLRVLEQQGVVDDADATLDVIQGVTGERAPARALREVADAGPGIDRDRAVAQLGDRVLQRRPELGERRGWAMRLAPSVPAQAFVDGVDGGVQERPAEPGQLGHGEHRREVLLAQRRLVAAGEIEAGDQQPVGGRAPRPAGRRSRARSIRASQPG